jgi:hypothetical protein
VIKGAGVAFATGSVCRFGFSHARAPLLAAIFTLSEMKNATAYYDGSYLALLFPCRRCRGAKMPFQRTTVNLRKMVLVS